MWILLIWSKTSLLFGRAYQSIKTKLSLDLEKRNHTAEEIHRFKISFILFHYLLANIGWWMVYDYWISGSFIVIPLPSTCAKVSNLKNLYDQKFAFDLHVYLSENETTFDKSQLIWQKQKLIYGDDQSVLTFNSKVLISEVGHSMDIDHFGR